MSRLSIPIHLAFCFVLCYCLTSPSDAFVVPNHHQVRQKSTVPLHAFWDKNKNKNSNENSTRNFFLRPAMMEDVGRSSQILADGFFKQQSENFLVLQWERLNTYLSLEQSFPKPNTLHQIFTACDETSGKVLGMAEVDARMQNGRGAYGPYMCNVAVDETCQRMGIASALVKQCEVQVQDWYTQNVMSQSLYLKVRESNTAAIGMYTKLGYTELRTEPDAKTGETVLVLRKQLGNSTGIMSATLKTITNVAENISTMT